MRKDVLEQLHESFEDALQENVLMANFSTMNVGGPADALLIAHSAAHLTEIVTKLWELSIPFKVIGSGSNLLISDRGVRGVVVINHAHNIKINTQTQPMTVWAESGALMMNVARQLANRGLSGMEWAATIPGTVGGAVYGNAGAFGKETCSNLIKAEVLHHITGCSEWSCDQLQYSYRASRIKREADEAVILSVWFEITPGDAKQVKQGMESYRQRRLQTQPPGASMGSVFRNPPHQKAGQLIEVVGLKGKKIGGAVISPQHANFIINEGGAKAKDVLDLMTIAYNAVEHEFKVALIPEIEVIGDWDELPDFLQSSNQTKVVQA